MLNVTDADGTAGMPATLQGDAADMFTIQASGLIEGAMPALEALDGCVAGKLKQQGAAATDTDALTFVLNQCRLQLASASSRQKVDATFIVTSMEKGNASLMISRRYTVPSEVTGAPLQLDEWPMRQCNVASGY